MKKHLIRVGVWETNSSSSHSLSIGSEESRDFVLETLYPDENGVIHIEGGDYGWGWDKFNDTKTKASYAAQQLGENENLIEVIKEVTGAEEVTFDISGGYVDHESQGIVSSDKEWLKNFIFNLNSWCFIGNDNSSMEESYFAVPEYKEDGTFIPVDLAYTLVCDKFDLSIDYVDEPTNEQIKEAFSNKLWDKNLKKDGTVVGRYSNRGETEKYMYEDFIDYETKELFYFEEKTYEDYRKDSRFEDYGWDVKPQKLGEGFLIDHPDKIIKVSFQVIKNN